MTDPDVDDYVGELESRGRHRPLFYRIHVVAGVLACLVAAVSMYFDQVRGFAITGALLAISGACAIAGRRAVFRMLGGGSGQVQFGSPTPHRAHVHAVLHGGWILIFGIFVMVKVIQNWNQ